MKREFYVSICHDCGGVDGSIAKIKSYNPARDLKEWASEGRNVKEKVLEKGERMRWCNCDLGTEAS
jgi:hypothetical protein